LEMPKTEILETVPVLILLYYLVLPVILAIAVTASVANRTFRKDYIAVLLIALLSIAAIIVLFDSHKVILIALSMFSCIGGVLIGTFFRRGMVSIKILVLSICFFLISCTFGAVLLQKYQQQAFGIFTRRDFNPYVIMLISTMEEKEQEGLPEKQKDMEKAQKVQQLRQELLTVIEKSITFGQPSMIIIAGITMGFIGFFKTQQLLLKTKQNIQDPLLFSQWQCPELLAFGFIFAGLATSTRLFWQQAVFIPYFGFNLLLPILWIYFFQGLSISSFLARKLKIPGYFLWIFYILFAIQPHFQLILSGIGIADIWLNFRKLIENSTAPKENNTDF